MRTNAISFVLGSENREKIVKTLFEYPKRQWSCSSVEDITKISHATVFRTLNGLTNLGILKSTKINKKALLYELVIDSPLAKELIKIIDIEKTINKKIASDFANKIKSKNIFSIVLYGSSVKGNLKPESDIDVLVILKKTDKILENGIYNIAAEVSSKVNRTISVTIMSRSELNKEKNSRFVKSIESNMEMIYGKNPF